MKRIFVFIAAFFIVGLAHGRERRQRNLSPGEAFFKGFGCLRCHRVGEAGGKIGPDLSYVGFRKGREWLDVWLKDPPAWKKGTMMPKFYFKDNIQKALLDYLVSLKGEAFKEAGHPWNSPELMKDPIKRGEVIFERVGCIGCHGERGKGGYPNNNVPGGKIPALTRVSDGYTKEELKEKIRKGVKPVKMNPEGFDPLISMPAWGEVLQEDELDAVVEYLFFLRPAKGKNDDW